MLIIPPPALKVEHAREAEELQVPLHVKHIDAQQLLDLHGELAHHVIDGALHGILRHCAGVVELRPIHIPQHL